jgi:YD repeat-containing protein
MGTLSGSVTKASDGTAISGATIQALQGGVVKGSASSAADGTYSISSLVAGSYDIKFSAAGYGTAISLSVSVTAGGTTSQNASLATPGSLGGQVTQSGGSTPVTGAMLTVYRGGESAGTATTDTNGNYTVSGLNSAAYRVEVKATGYLVQDQTGVTVTSGGTTTQNFSLSPSGTSAVSYVYDELGRLVGAVDPSGSAAGYGFDAVGNVVSIGRSAAGQVSVLNFSPKSGPVGTTVTITGTSFSATSSQDSVSFHGTSGTVTSATTSQIITTVPTGATTGPIQVTAPSGTFTTSTNFTVTANNGAPTITSFTPTIATGGTSVTATGTNFDPIPANDRLKFNTTFQAVTSATATSFTANVPSNTASGRLTLSTTSGTVQSSQDLFIAFGSHVAGDVGFTGRTTITGTQTISLGTASKIGLLVFDATAGQQVSALLSGSTFSSCTLYLYSPTGTQMSYSGCTSATTFFDTASLPATGTYTFGLEPNGTTGSITLGLNNPTTITGSITPGGSAVTETTTIPGQDVRLTFSGTANQRVSLLTNNVTVPSALVNLVKPDGTTQVTNSISNGNSTFMDVQTLATTGTYTVWVQHINTNVGSETLQLYNVPADVTTSASIGGAAVPISTTVPGQNAYVTFSGTSGHSVTVNLTNGTYASGGCNISLKDPSGAPVWGNVCYGATNTIGPTTLGSTGTYTLFIDPQRDATGGVTVQLTGN